MVISIFKNHVQAIGRYCHELQCLNLGWCEEVGDVGVMSLAYGCPDLRIVDLCGCVQITGILHTVEIRKFAHLTVGLIFCQFHIAHVCIDQSIAKE